MSDQTPPSPIKKQEQQHSKEKSKEDKGKTKVDTSLPPSSAEKASSTTNPTMNPPASSSSAHLEQNLGSLVTEFGEERENHALLALMGLRTSSRLQQKQQNISLEELYGLASGEVLSWEPNINLPLKRALEDCVDKKDSQREERKMKGKEKDLGGHDSEVELIARRLSNEVFEEIEFLNKIHDYYNRNYVLPDSSDSASKDFIKKSLSYNISISDLVNLMTICRKKYEKRKSGFSSWDEFEERAFNLAQTLWGWGTTPFPYDLNTYNCGEEMKGLEVEQNEYNIGEEREGLEEYGFLFDVDVKYGTLFDVDVKDGTLFDVEVKEAEEGKRVEDLKVEKKDDLRSMYGGEDLKALMPLLVKETCERGTSFMGPMLKEIPKPPTMVFPEKQPSKYTNANEDDSKQKERKLKGKEKESVHGDGGGCSSSIEKKDPEDEKKSGG